jgi:tripartite ATP-independent transporter DctP family solute receptor
MKTRRIFLESVAFVMILSLVFIGSSFAAPEFIIKFGDEVNPDHPHFKAEQYFAKLVGEKSKGAIEVRNFPSGQVGVIRVMIEGLQMGSIEMCKAMTANLGGFNKRFMGFDLPYIFRDREHFYKVLDGPVGNRFLTKELSGLGLVGLTYFDAGSRSVYNTKRVINEPNDMKGMKIRVPENPLMIDTINAMGAGGVPLPFSDIYNALQQGVIDGAENAMIILYFMKHYEVAKYFSLTEHFRTPDIILISQKFWDKLPKQYQTIIKECGIEMTKVERKLWQEEEQKTMDALRAKGVKINEVKTELFREKIDKVWKKYTDTIGSDVIDSILKQ